VAFITFAPLLQPAPQLLFRWVWADESHPGLIRLDPLDAPGLHPAFDVIRHLKLALAHEVRRLFGRCNGLLAVAKPRPRLHARQTS